MPRSRPPGIRPPGPRRLPRMMTQSGPARRAPAGPAAHSSVRRRRAAGGGGGCGRRGRRADGLRGTRGIRSDGPTRPPSGAFGPAPARHRRSIRTARPAPAQRRPRPVRRLRGWEHAAQHDPQHVPSQHPQRRRGPQSRVRRHGGREPRGSAAPVPNAHAAGRHGPQATGVRRHGWGGCGGCGRCGGYGGWAGFGGVACVAGAGAHRLSLPPTAKAAPSGPHATAYTSPPCSAIGQPPPPPPPPSPTPPPPTPQLRPLPLLLAEDDGEMAAGPQRWRGVGAVWGGAVLGGAAWSGAGGAGGVGGRRSGWTRWRTTVLSLEPETRPAHVPGLRAGPGAGRKGGRQATDQTVELCARSTCARGSG
jgi:hypothetical protein